MQPICSTEHLGTLNKGTNVVLLWLVVFAAAAAMLAIYVAPRVRGVISRFAVFAGFVVTAGMFAMIILSIMFEWHGAVARFGVGTCCALLSVIIYALCIDVDAEQRRRWLADWWQSVWYRIDAALTAQEKKAEAELAERRRSGRRLPWWRRLFY